MNTIQGVLILFSLSGPVPGVLQVTKWDQTYPDVASCRTAVDVKATELNTTVPQGVKWAGVCF
jgi:hypothetical protein